MKRPLTPSLPGIARRKTRVNALMTRQSIVFRKKMDARVKPAHDGRGIDGFRMKRREFIALLGGAAAAWPLAVDAQAERVRSIAVLTGLPATDPLGQAEVAAFRHGLQELGWVPGRNIQIEYRWPDTDIDLIGAAATELVALKPEVILARATPSVAAVRRETSAIPVVFLQVADPLGVGFVQSLSRPGGNITGFTNFEASLGGKWLELLKEIAPGVKRVAALFNPDTAPYAGTFLRTIEAAAPAFGVEPITATVRNADEIEGAIAAVAREPGGGIVQIPDSFTLAHRESIIGLLARHRLPAIYSNHTFPASGGLIAYAVDSRDIFRRAASYVDRILKGTKPLDLPVQQPTKFELVINLKTAKALGLDVPSTLLARADEVIE
jgi:putative ABC transport system substrate-binding protein